ncbi:MAG: hypothetical protein QOK43_3066 [Acidimicrobiaceae bacterium]|nr:hypothetical protein [Acidimicrobiaceae bacterium]
MRRPSLTAAITVAVILAATAFVFVELQPALLFRNTTPSGGDMGAHVWGPAYLRDHLLPHGRLSGWTPDWYDGFPALVFYFPLPSVLIVALSTVVPYGIAFKLVTVLGLLTLPAAAWFMGRFSGMKDPVPACLAVAMVPFMFDRTFTIYGGNIASTLAGEFAFSISLSLALVFLGVYARGLATGRYRALSAGLLALTALCHVVPAFFAIAGAVVLALLHFRWKAFAYMAWTLGVSGLLAGFWVVPFLARLAYTNDMGWEKITTFRQTLLHHDDRWVMLLALAGAIISLALRRRSGAFLILMGAASGLAFVYAPDGRLWNARLLPFWVLSAYLLAGVAVGEFGRLMVRGAVALAVPPPDPFMAGVGAGEAGALDADELGADEADDLTSRPTPEGDADDGGAFDRSRAARSRLDPANIVVPVLALAVALYFVATPLHILPDVVQPKTLDRSFIPDWAKWNYSGYERKASYPEYHDIVKTMATVGRDHGCGRAMWEYEPELDRLGTPMALMLLPYWTEGCIGSMEGLFFESSATTPYHFLNQSELSFKPSSAQRDLHYRSFSGDQENRAAVLAQGVHHLQLMGVRYYMTISPEVQAVAASNPDLELLATSGPWDVNYNRANELIGVQPRTWHVYLVKDSALVTPLPYKPAVMQGVAKGGKPWLAAAQDWYLDEARWDVPLAVSGPADWPRVRGADPTPPRLAVGEGEGTTVSRIRTTDDRISFDVSKPGTPVLVKASYFPNWQASGAKGPWRVAPNLMVVVPTSNHVSLHYGNTPVEGVAWLCTLLGLVGLAYLFLAQRRSRRRPPNFSTAPAAVEKRE